MSSSFGNVPGLGEASKNIKSDLTAGDVMLIAAATAMTTILVIQAGKVLLNMVAPSTPLYRIYYLANPTTPAATTDVAA